MKKRYFLKTTILVAATALMSTGALRAQGPQYTLFKGGEAIDSVTVGAIVSYNLENTSISAPGLSFIYQWNSFQSDKTTSAGWVFKIDQGLTNGLTSAPNYNDHVLDTEVYVRVPATKADYYLQSVIQPVFNGKKACRYDTLYMVRLVDKPTLDLKVADTLVCCNEFLNAGTFTVPKLELAGVGSWEIGFSTQAYTFDGNTTVGTAKTGTFTNIGTVSSKLLTIDYTAQTTDLFPDLTAVQGVDIAKNGISYVITFKTITDRILRKSYNKDVLAAIDTKDQKTFTVYVLPSVVTQPLKHLKNLP